MSEPLSSKHPWTQTGGPQPVRLGEEAFGTLVALAEGAQCDREGVAETPERAARAWRFLTSGYGAPPDLKVFPADGCDEIVAVRNVPLYSLCEHHLLPFVGTAHVAYLPHERILGLSKFARLIDHYARRLQVQERLTKQIADHLDSALGPRGVAVIIEAEHLCMTMRGVERPGTSTRTSVMRGAFRDQPQARAEAMRLLGF